MIPTSNRAPWTDTDDATLIVLGGANTPRRDSAIQLGHFQEATAARILRLRQRGLV